MLDYFLAEVFRASKKHPELDGRAAHDSFRDAAALVLSQRLTALRHERDASPSSGTALVVRKASAIEDKFGQFKYGKSKAPNTRDVDAFAKGAEAGRKININPGTPIEDRSASTATRLA